MDTSELQVARLDSAREKKVKALQQELGFRIVALDPPSHLANLTPQQRQQLEAFEQGLGVSLVAYEPVARLRLATPSEAHTRELRAVERKLGYVLVAYEPMRPEPQRLDPRLQRLGAQAQLSDEQFARLQQVEDEVGAVLLAFQAR